MSDAPVLLAVEGISGAGKSAVVARAAAAFGWTPLAEAYDRLVPRPRIGARTAPALARVERALLAEEAVRWRTAAGLREQRRTVIADTGFLGPITYAAALETLGLVPTALRRELLGRARRLADRGAWGVPDGVLYLATDPATRRRRAAGDRARHPAALAARHEAVGRWEERFWLHRFSSAFPSRLRAVDATGDLRSVVAAVGRAARRFPARAAGPTEARAALGLLAGPLPVVPSTGRRAPRATVKKTPQSAGAPPR